MLFAVIVIAFARCSSAVLQRQVQRRDLRSLHFPNATTSTAPTVNPWTSTSETTPDSWTSTFESIIDPWISTSEITFDSRTPSTWEYSNTNRVSTVTSTAADNTLWLTSEPNAQTSTPLSLPSMFDHARVNEKTIISSATQNAIVSEADFRSEAVGVATSIATIRHPPSSTPSLSPHLEISFPAATKDTNLDDFMDTKGGSRPPSTNTNFPALTSSSTEDQDSSSPGATGSNTNPDSNAVSDTSGVEKGGSKQQATTAGITIAATSVAAALGFAIFIVARRRRRRLYQQTNSTASSLDFQCPGIPDNRLYDCRH